MKVHTALPSNTTGLLQLWRVEFRSSYYDNDPRMPGQVPLKPNFYVLANGYQEAISACADKIQKYVVEYKLQDKITSTDARPVPLEVLQPAIPASFGDSSKLFSSALTKVVLTDLAEVGRYRLAICLIEEDDDED